jgi:hypothetical protein
MEQTFDIRSPIFAENVLAKQLLCGREAAFDRVNVFIARCLVVVLHSARAATAPRDSR